MTDSPAAPDRCAALSTWLGPALIVVSGIAMLIFTWGTWPDVLIDFGRELYVPWQITEGKALYRDIAWFNGPLSPYLNALWFSIFGVSLRTLVICNLAVLAALCALLYRMFSEISSRPAATAAVVFFIGGFAFSQYEATGGSNYICPYSHEIVHGLVLGLASLWVLSRCAIGRQRMRRLVISGVLLGGVWLTKPECFVAAAVGDAAGLLAIYGSGRRFNWRELGGFAAGVVITVAVAAALIATFVCPTSVVPGVLGGWPYVLLDELRALPFYRAGMGTDDLGRNLAALWLWAGGYALLIAIVTSAALCCSKLSAAAARIIALLLTCAIVAAMLLMMRHIAWPWLARPLPIFLTGLIVVGLIRLRPRDTTTTTPARSHRFILQFMLAAYSLALLLKMMMAARLEDYGFALAMPGTLLLVVALIDWLPGWFTWRGGAPGSSGRCGGSRVAQLAMLAAVACAVAGLVRTTHRFTEHKSIPVADGADRFVAAGRGRLVNRLLDGIRQHVAPNETIVAMPEGAMINYLARRTNPTRHLKFLPPELLMFGQADMIDSLRVHPPDWILLIHRNTLEYGPQFFGADYGRELMAWVGRNYHRIDRVGDEPFVDERFGIVIMRRTE